MRPRSTICRAARRAARRAVAAVGALAALAALAPACGDPARGPVGTPTTGGPAVASPGDAASSAATTGPALSELDARALLAGGLRAAGYRIRHDVAHPAPGGPVVLDGWDAERGVGFEYVATAEGDAAVGPADRAALGDRILVVDPADEATIRAALDGFVARLPPPAP